jgi:hypothetical protein
MYETKDIGKVSLNLLRYLEVYLEPMILGYNGGRTWLPNLVSPRTYERGATNMT